MKLILSTRAYKNMKLHTNCASSKRAARNLATVPAGSKAVQAMTLVEMLVAVGVGSLVLIGMAVIFMTSARSYVAMGNYVSMDAASRTAIDHMSLQVRQAGKITEFSPTHLKFSLAAQPSSFLVYDWNPANGCLTEWQTGNTVTNTLLTGCDALTFSLVNAAFNSTTNFPASKGLSVNWKCSRKILGNKSTTEEMQQALIVIRKPLS
jgi:type II secretory pathway component PulJ